MTDKPTPDPDDGNFFERWSRRKREQAGGRSGEGERAAPGDAPSAAPVEQADMEAPLPSIDDLTADSDITAFLRKGVSEELRRLALRRVWALDPAIAGFVEVAENQYDWNTPGGAPGYGELAAGTDIEALLAQATGRSVPSTETAETAVNEAQQHANATSPVEVEPDANAADSVAKPGVESDVEDVETAEDHADAGEAGPTIEPTPSKLAPAPTRRHGGALPI